MMRKLNLLTVSVIFPAGDNDNMGGVMFLEIAESAYFGYYVTLIWKPKLSMYGHEL